MVAPNLLDRNFEPDRRNQVWAGDITYVSTRQGWSYLAIVMDLHSRRIIGWAFALQADTELVIRAIQQARARRRPPPEVMFHSDQGCQYTSAYFVGDLKANGMVQSMSRKGNCWDTQSKIASERRTDLTRAGIGRATLALTCRSGSGVPRALPGSPSVT
ncbi:MULTISPECIES: DDE-type integrase/transposase/recombinase [Paraburkholderia]|uniref:DDE-type integrase/transposase/recombinase n=1 Tax=Paraburkholderia TaxID=1822464 RepID=UPI0027DF8B10|nr:DDE-type integrase/transposase/recombinase [Paraburkholderia aspalathi]